MSEFSFEPSGATSQSQQEFLDDNSRRRTLLHALDHVKRREVGAPGLVELVEALGLDDELAQLASSSPERLKRWEQVRASRTVDE
jgi:hypothetical protein